jgi:tyrosine decarboxylase/aspartate 1-decarboxylase
LFEEIGKSKDGVLSELEDFLKEDVTYQSGHPVSSMSSKPHHLGVEVFSKTIERNAGRMHIFQGVEKIEHEIIEMVGDLLGLEMALGTTTSGGTESNILAMLAMREASKKVKHPEVIAPETIHPSIAKAAWILGVKLVKTRVDKTYKASAKEIEKVITKNTVGIVATAGTTYLGQIDPIDKIGELALERGLLLHIDAAFGGFVIPFLNDLGFGPYKFDFSNKGVTSISTDPHKMGFAPIPSGCLILREKKHLKSITSKMPYLRGSSSKQTTLLGTRPAGSILATWALMKNLGRKGYRDIVSDCMVKTRNVKERIEQNPLLDTAIEPVMNILGVTSKEVTLERIAVIMEKRGWKMAISPVPSSIRLVLMPHITYGTLNALFNDLDYASTTIPAD